MKHFLILLGVVFVALILAGVARITTVAFKGTVLEKQNKQYIDYASTGTPLPCGPGLAAQDLAGVCRRKPNPTPGALEAIGDPNSGEPKIQSKSTSKKSNRTFQEFSIAATVAIDMQTKSIDKA